MERVVADQHLVTAHGYTGNRALEITGARPDSLNSTKMNMKMFAEMFRLLGWVSPAEPKKSYPIQFTLLGACAAESHDAAISLLKESLLGYVNPSEHTRGVKYSEHVRFFPLALRTLRDLGGRMYKHEMCIGPMSFSETGSTTYEQMIESILNIRGDHSRLQVRFEELSKELGMQPTSVDNMTRFPIAALRAAGWIQTGVSDRSLYNKQLNCFEITDEGQRIVQTANDTYSVDLHGYKQVPTSLKHPLIRHGVFSMLQRADFNIESVQEQFESDLSTLQPFLKGRELLFSPYQTLHVNEIDQALGNVAQRNSSVLKNIDVYKSKNIIDLTLPRRASQLVTTLTLNSLTPQSSSSTDRTPATDLTTRIKTLLAAGKLEGEIVDMLFVEHRKDKKDDFYPLIADLFTMLGLPCSVSRHGDNGARWDAIIKSNSESIPIEIKSPTEEIALSLKAVRQALENKIVLLARGTHKTKRSTTSLAVGYEVPTARAETLRLVEAIYSAYNLRIGIITLRTLLVLSVKAVANNLKPDPKEIRALKGYLDVSF